MLTKEGEEKAKVTKVCVCVHEYQINAPNKGFADCDDDLIITRSRPTDLHLCRRMSLYREQVECVTVHNKGLNQAVEV